MKIKVKQVLDIGILNIIIIGILAIPFFLSLVVISLLLFCLFVGKDMWILIPGKYYKYIWLKFVSFLINRHYKNKYKVYYNEAVIDLNMRIKEEIASLQGVREQGSIDFIKKYFDYKPDIADGLLDWIGDPYVQWMRMLYDKNTDGEMKHSFDCDDYAEFLEFLIRKSGGGPDDWVRSVSVVSKKPFLKMTHSFTISLIIKPKPNELGEFDSKWCVYSPYSFLGAVDTVLEIVGLIDKYFKVTYYKFLI